MQKAPALLALIAALAAGSASAAGTLAGTTITNTASAEFPDPNNPTDPTKNISSPSNTVSTVVLPKPAFDVTYSDGTTDGGTQNALNTTTVVVTGAVPGQKVPTNYSLVNNGNVALSIALAADTSGSAGGEVVKYYYANADGSQGAEITSGSVTVNPQRADDPATTGVDESFSGIIKIIQVVTLPTDPAQIDSSKVFGASPVGTVTGTQGADPLVTPGNGYASGTTVNEDGKAAATDRQFVRVTVYTPSLDNNPNTSATNPVDSGGQPITNPALIPPVTSVDAPTETTGKPNDNTPVVAAPGYVTPGAPASDPTPGGTPITTNLATDEQIAYPKADTNATPDTVVFTNTIKNTGTATDVVQLYPVLADGTADPAYTYDDTTGVFTNSTTGVKVSFLDPVTGAVIKKSTDPANPTAALYPTVTVPSGSTGVYRVQVTFPDPSDTDFVSAVSVLIGADSLKDADVVSNSATRNTILPPAAQFGDATTAQGTDTTPVAVQTVDPSGATGGPTSPDGGVGGDRTAAFPMDVANTGQYNDSYTLSGSVTFTDAVSGAPTVVPVLYYAPDGTLLPRVSTDPASADYNKFITPVIAPGTEYKPVAVVQTPAGTKTGDYTVSQTATGNYSTVSITDSNDIVRVSAAGSVPVAKFVAKSGVAAGSDPMKGIPNPAGYTATGANGAKPGDQISYRITAKNNYNTAVTKFFLRDTVPANTELSSVALFPTATKTIYRVGGNSGTWSATAPANGLAAGTVIDTALDVNSDLIPDDLAPGATFSVDFVVTVK
ncbi:putative repeat protein (TIGR01451 family) [Deinococcus metalli]|uniref:DUF11 domain-containing protein n=1 Tax=Deinococcus metalli TaxID=1141878 RepID=A0A7W8KGZ6_9DEIO|nr:hypothetical protein [Deinococcus metalli]MBB5377623.1 putative repeat protein (TIGR01451 family) [Deinococcus metalli]GHF52125.1 DUF11 domain-containing protein [Deinococcus metalli]